jgi:hypothetical protein
MRRFLIATTLLLWFVPVLSQAPGQNRIVAIGDIHGAYDEFVGLLKSAGLIDDKLSWSGGRATLVQTGDYTDRGAGVRQVLDLIMRLEREAKKSGGQLVALLGNHEIMNLIGDWRDVTPEICATFTKNAVDDGCVAYREAMSPNGTYGRWLREKQIATRIGDTLFMHAGINPARPAPRSIDEVNEQARAEVRRLDQYRQRLVRSKLADPSFTLQQILEVSGAELKRASEAFAANKANGTPLPAFDVPLLSEAEALMGIAKWSVVDPEGPLWFRGYAQWQEAETAPQVLALLDSLKIARIVVAHTVTPDRKIGTRFDGRVYLIDTGMLASAYKGTPSALEITADSVKPIYSTGAVTVPQ